MPFARPAFVLTLAAAGLTLLASAPRALAAEAEAKRHHLTLGAGYARHLDDSFKEDDLQDCASGQFAYRYTVSPHVDLAIEGRSVMASQDVVVLLENGEFSHTASYFGPGVRFQGAAGSVQPYVQASVYFARETVRLDVGNTGTDTSEDGVGFGVAGGADIRLSRLLSLPIEVNYLYAKPENDVSSLGLQLGLTFNFGRMP